MSHKTYLAIALLGISLTACGQKKDEETAAPASQPSGSQKAQESSQPNASRVVAAKVGNVYIYRDEVLDQLKKQGVDEAKKKEAYKNFLRAMVNMKMVEEFIKTTSIAEDADVKEALEAQKNQLLTRAFFSKELKKRVTPEKIQQVFDANRNQFGKEKVVVFEQIVVPKNNKALAGRIISGLTQGQKFETLAKKHSMRPEHINSGLILESTLVPDVHKALTALRKGDFTNQPIETPFAWLVLRLVKREDASESLIKERKVDPLVRREIAEAIMNEVKAAFPVSSAVDLDGNPVNLEEEPKSEAQK